jgi:hypothetical protein
MKKLVVCLIMLFVVQIGLADIIATDNGNQTITRYAEDLSQIWQSTGNRSVQKITVSPLNGNVYTGYTGTDKMAKQNNAYTGAYLYRTIPSANTVAALEFGFDYNSDGIADLWAVGDNKTMVYDGATTASGNPATLLNSWTIADSTTAIKDGAGGHAIVFGPDLNNDGVGEMFVGKGVNANGGRINVWDPVTMTRLASYNADTTRDIGAMIMGPDANGDGQSDLLVVSSRNYQLQAYDYATGAFIRVIDEGLAGRYFPLDIEMLPGGSLLMGTRMKSELDPGWVTGAETAGGNLIRLDPVNSGSTLAYTPTLLKIAAGTGQFTGVTYVPEPATLVLLGLGTLALARKKK